MTPINPQALHDLEELSGYLARDPSNAALRADAAEAAMAAGMPEKALAFVMDFSDHRLTNIAGLALLQLGRHGEAAQRFDMLRSTGEDAPGLCYNLAYALAMEKDWQGALAALGASPETLPQAAALEVGLLHQVGRLHDAGERTVVLLALHPTDRALNAAASVLALDIGDEALAARTAAQAGNHPDAVTTTATLALDRGEIGLAERAFQQAIEGNPNLPRAWIGRGLARLAASDPAAAAPDLDRGAEMFGTHLGSWIAAGWAHLLAGDRSAAKARFVRARDLDPTFAEAHGSLAVMDLLEGRPHDAERSLRIARGLDRQCFSSALGDTLLATARNDSALAEAIFRRALKAPIDDSGRTVGTALTKLGRATHL